MRGINKVVILGHLGSAPEVKQLTNGNRMATMSLATSESWKDKNTGEIQNKTEWHRVVLFGRLAEIAEQYLTKGSLVYVEGQLQTRKWTDQQQIERYTTDIVVGIGGVLQILDKKTNDNSASAPVEKQMLKTKEEPEQIEKDWDDIPF